jgi:DNA-binding MarR family transcriptional regulator
MASCLGVASRTRQYRQSNLQVWLLFLYDEIVMSRKTLDLAVIDFIQAIGLLVRRVRSAAASHDLSLTEAAVMARLLKDGPATTADLARAEAMKPQSMGTTIAALEEMGMVERKAHPTDGRQINIELTAQGATTWKSAKAAKRAWLTEAIAQLDKQEQETLFAAGEIIKRLAEL